MSRKEATPVPRAPGLRHGLKLAAGAVAVVGACVALRAWWPGEPAAAQKTDVAAAAAAADHAIDPAAKAPKPLPDVVAVVNGEKISRQELAGECLRYHGKDVLESLVNKELILDHCRQRGIAISDDEIDAEVQRLARRFNVPVEQWLRMLHQERGIQPEQYRRDIIWPTLALRKLAADRLQVTPKELAEAFEMEYGARVKVRMIGIYRDGKKAQEVRAKAAAHPEQFGKLARQFSDDPESAAANGWIQPIRRHAGDKRIEEAAFALKEGEVSPVLQVRDQYVILLCEGQVPPANVNRADAEPRLEELIKDRKLRAEAAELFQALQKNAKIVNVMNDARRRQEMPGVAATVNGRKITVRQLSEECMARHGKETLRGMVNRRLIEQALRQKKRQVTQEDLDEELDDVAARMVPLKKGKPDRQEWLRQVTSEPGVTEELYLHDAIWPSVALKLLVKDTVKITEEDMKKGFEANYGPRVRCRAIVLDDARTAKKVWDMARRNPSPDYFGKLAEEYSTDAPTRANKGETHPIGRHAGRPALEQEAFSLEDGELSGIIQTDGKYVILLCEGRTEPMDVKMSEVRSLLYDHIYRQKLNAAMGQQFDRLQQVAQVTNYLEPSASHEPQAPSARTAARGAAQPAPAKKK